MPRRGPSPKTILAQLDPGHVALYLRDGQDGLALMLALANINSYLREAGRQQSALRRVYSSLRREFERLSEAVRNPERFPLPRRQQRRVDGFRIAHFYLTCWHMVYKHLLVVRGASRLREVGLALRPHIRLFDRYETMRNHFEHFSERLPGQRRAHEMRGANVFSGLNGYELVFGRDRVDVGPRSLRLLRQIVGKVLTAFKGAAVEEIARRNPDDLLGLLNPIRTRYILRDVQRRLRRDLPAQSNA